MTLQDFDPPVKLKLSALWAALMFCYLYADFFGFFMPGRLASMNQGMMNPIGPATPYLLLGTAVMMAIPSLMVFASLALRPVISRGTNVVLGAVYGLIITATMIGAPLFYIFFGSVEVALSVGIVWYALRWPRLKERAA